MAFVLIVEPDEVNASRIRAILDGIDKNFEYELTMAVERGIDILEERKPDVFIGDMVLPIVSGAEFFSMVEMMSPETVRIVITESGKIEETVSFMNECKVFKIIMKPCRIAEDLLEPIEAAFRYKKIQMRMQKQESAAADHMLTAQEQLAQMEREYKQTIEDSHRICSVFTELFRCNLGFGSYSDPDVKQALEDWYAWMINEYKEQLMLSEHPFAERARALLQKYHIPEERYLMKINANQIQAVDLKSAGVLIYLMELLLEACKRTLMAYQVVIMVESMQKGHILHFQCMPGRSQNGTIVVLEKNPAIRAAIKKAAETGMAAFGFKCAVKPNENSVLVNIAIPR